ncbi:MAG: XTP/dITP diphosphatase [Candidatus Jordarchaeum sp.]|uniref:XTP/dITP diphosphatase n=1 Tax=Candidatus Jordarchaeum sp. TaxID=2823881 RepID=UPI00404B4A80
MDRITIFFATGNIVKVEEAERILKEYNISILHLPMKLLEIQSENLEEIAVFSAQKAWADQEKPLFVEDAGLFIKRLNGFPGPYSSYVFKTISNEGVLGLMAQYEDRIAYFQSVIAFCSGKKTVTFKGEVYGKISRERRGNFGFGFDPIFIPDEGDGRTFGEMNISEKTAISHRTRALRKFAEWVKSTDISKFI